MKKVFFGLLIFLMFTIMVVGCSNESNDGGNAPAENPSNENTNNKDDSSNNNVPDTPKKPVKNTDPVTLNVLIQVPGMTDEEFTEFFIDPVQKDNPHISFNLIRQGEGINLEELIMAGEIPDMVYGGPNLFGPLEMDYPLDLRDALIQYNVDISQITNTVMDSITAYGKNGEILAIPFTMNSYALWYNKDIFDKFGEDYPKDGMTWDEAIELGKKVTGMDGGEQYRGIDVINTNIGKFAEPLTIELLDRESNEAIISDQWNDVFNLAMKAYNIPGNERVPPGRANLPALTQDRNLAMGPFWTNGMVSNLPKLDDFNWGVAQLPAFPEAPDTYIMADHHQLVVSKTTERVDAVIEVLRVAISEEIQDKINRLGKLTVLKDQKIKDQFAADIEEFQGKNIKGIFKSEPAERLLQDQYYHQVFVAINQAFAKVMVDGVDVNTALREAKEVADQAIAEIKAGE